MKKHFISTDGFTLIELMVTLALVGLVISGGFSLYYFADRSFVSGTITADVQADVQLAMQRITNELRLAHRVEFGAPIPNSGLSEYDHYLFINDDGLIVLRTQRGDQILTPHGQSVAEYEMSFGTVNDVPDTLRVTLASTNEQVPYGLEADIQVLNIRLGGFSGTSPSESIYFSKTLSTEERETAEAIRRRCLFSSVVFDDQDPDLGTFRRFRDERLQKSKLGQAIVKWYYDNSPFLAGHLEDNWLALMVVRSSSRIFASYLRLSETRSYIFFTSLLVWFTLAAINKRCVYTH